MTMNAYAPSAPGATRWLRLFVLTLFVSLLSVQAAQAGDGKERNTMTGNWIAAVARPAPLTPLQGLSTYSSDGTSLGESNSTVIRSLSHGSWEKDGPRQFTRFTLEFTFDAARNFTGTTERTTRIQLSEDGQTYASLSTSTRRFDAAGNLVSTVVDPAGIETGRRY
jgi:hypothetical protein